METLLEYFLKRLPKDLDPEKCWLWQGSKFRNGYGQITYSKKLLKAHRISYQLFNNIEVPADIEVMHNCPRKDNKLCVNFRHLKLGTPKEHGEDRISKDQMIKGSKHYRAKLTEEQVIRIKYRLQQGVSCAKISKDERVGESTIEHIKLGHTWKHVKLEGIK